MTALRLFVLGCLVAAAVAVGGCGGADSASTDETTTPQAISASSKAAERKRAKARAKARARKQAKARARKQAKARARRRAAERERQRQEELAQQRAEQQREQERQSQQTTTESNCEPGYDPCVPTYPPDLDCADLNGPYSVSGSDPHGLDADGDGVGCE
jgi:hypothetical protein